MALLLTFTPCSSLSIVNLEHVIADWVTLLDRIQNKYPRLNEQQTKVFQYTPKEKAFNDHVPTFLLNQEFEKEDSIFIQKIHRNRCSLLIIYIIYNIYVS